MRKPFTGLGWPFPAGLDSWLLYNHWEGPLGNTVLVTCSRLSPCFIHKHTPNLRGSGSLHKINYKSHSWFWRSTTSINSNLKMTANVIISLLLLITSFWIQNFCFLQPSSCIIFKVIIIFSSSGHFHSLCLQPQSSHLLLHRPTNSVNFSHTKAMAALR